LHVLSQNESSSVLASTKNKQNIIHFSTEMLFLSLIWFLNNMYKKGIVQFKSTDACFQNIEQNNVVLLTNQDKSFMFLLSRTCCLLKASWCSWDMVQMDQNVNFVGSNATNQQWLPNNCVKSSYPERSLYLWVTSQDMLLCKECLARAMVDSPAEQNIYFLNTNINVTISDKVTDVIYSWG